MVAKFGVMAGLVHLVRAQGVRVDSLGAYPGYDGPSEIRGGASLVFNSDGVVFMTFGLEGVENECSAPDADTPNSCGIHIHEGTSCADAASPGGHYYDKDAIKEDPWATASYKAFNTHSRGNVKVTNGFDYDANIGHALVVHDYAGARVTCALINPVTFVEVLDVGKYPDYSGDVDISGSVGMGFSGTAVSIYYNLRGVEKECASPDADATNSCGIHIHEGKSCADATQPGGHYFANTTDSDPWAPAVYVSKGSSAFDQVVVDYGYGLDTTRGRVLVVHDRSGARVTCAVIGETVEETVNEDPCDVCNTGVCAPCKPCVGTDAGPCAPCWAKQDDGSACLPDCKACWGAEAENALATVDETVTDAVIAVGNLGMYPGYAGDLKVFGSARLYFQQSGEDSGSVLISYILSGVEKECVSPSNATNSCGIHIHEGTSCDNATAPAGHYYNNDTITSDPWGPAVYNISRASVAVGAVEVTYGYDYESTVGRVLVLHDRSGARVTCAVLAASNDKTSVAVRLASKGLNVVPKVASAEEA